MNLDLNVWSDMHAVSDKYLLGLELKHIVEELHGFFIITLSPFMYSYSHVTIHVSYKNYIYYASPFRLIQGSMTA